MKKILSSVLCCGMLAAMLCVPASAVSLGDFDLKVNGKEVSFSDAVPQLKNNRSFLPMAATFEALGYSKTDITWDDSTKTVTATKDGKTISLTIGQKEITLSQEDGAASTGFQVDAAPYIDPATSRTYIPVGLVADALGFSVGWDGENKTVIVDDIASILAGNTATYQLMDQYLAYVQDYSQGNYQLAGGYDLRYEMGIDGESLEAKAAGSYTELTSDSALQFDTSMTLSGSLLNTEKTLNGSLRGDLENGVLYLQSSALPELLGTGTAESWYKLDLADLADSIPSSELSSILMQLAYEQKDSSFANSLKSMLQEFKAESASQTAADLLELCNELFSDDAFQKSGSDYVSSAAWNGGQCTVTLNTSGSKVNGGSIQVSGTASDLGSFTVTSSMKNNKMEVSMASSAASTSPLLTITTKLELNLDGTYQNTGTKPQSAPPAGAEVVDLNARMLKAFGGII